MPDSDAFVVRRLEFLGGLALTGGWRPAERLPEIAFVGRSNVGKSSLLNLLVRRRAFARVSNTPGRTQEINFFRVNGEFLLVDLPGYGYARAAKEKRYKWRGLLDDYLTRTKQLRGVVALLDVRREPSPEDLLMLDRLADVEVPVLAAVTKIDKVNATARRSSLQRIVDVTGLDEEQIVPVSARTGEGRDELAAAITQLLKEPAWHPA
jgi:GTP-binding protein